MRIAFTILCILAMVLECLVLSFIYIMKKDFKEKRAYTFCLIASLITILSYVISINTENYFVTSFSSSVYFVSIDWVLMSCLVLMVELTSIKLNWIQKVSLKLNAAFAVFDFIVLMINPFKEIAIGYIKTGSNIAIWEYNPKFLYMLHLVFCYIVVFEIAWTLFEKMTITPKLYRGRYSLILDGLLVIVLLNCIFLFAPQFEKFKFDISVLLYSAMFILVFYNSTYYATKKIRQEAPREVLMEMRYPIIIFDYEKNYAISNKAASIFLNGKSKNTDLNEFISSLGLNKKITETGTDTYFEWPYKDHIYRCDYQVMRKKKAVIAYVFTFTEASTEYDLLTGFHTYVAAMRDFRTTMDDTLLPAGVAVCDVNRLTYLNDTYGKSTGDEVITTVASELKNIFPEDTYYVRLQDAFLMAVIPKTTTDKMKAFENEISDRLKNSKVVDGGIEIEYAFSMLTYGQPDIEKAISSAEYSIKIKKLMDQRSAHSSLLFSLMRTMQEADPGTRAHVSRTRTLGEKLAQKINLTDEETAKLSILCILHDIGKLGIPVEILNKPTKLTKQEWELLRTHVIKGYRIAKASRELEPIADVILHHHECWDGSGYPNGLSKEEIPLLSRIIAIVDSYDAMTNDRPYRKAVSRHKALDEIERCAGKQFDPYLASEFVNMVRQEEEYISEKEETETTEDVEWEKRGTLPEMKHTENTTLAPVSYSRYILEMEDETVVSADEHFEELTGYNQDDIETGLVSQSTLIFPDDLEAYNRLKVRMLKESKQAFIEHRLRMKDGTPRSVFCHGWIFFDPSVRKQRVQIEISDLSDSLTLKQIVENERIASNHTLEMWKDSLRRDALTGVLNRAAFRNEVQEAIIKNEKTCVVIMCDIDAFKQYNDSYGHVKGDGLLHKFAGTLSDNVSDNGVVCRMGGDEFSVALYFNKDTDTKSIEKDIAMFWKNVDGDMQQYDANISVSMGATMSVGNEKNFSELYKEADDALYKAKEQGKRQLVIAWNS